MDESEKDYKGTANPDGSAGIRSVKILPDDGYPRILDKEGCLYGQHVEKQVVTLCKKLDTLDKKMDVFISRLTIAAIAFGSAAVMLVINVIINLLLKGVVA